MNNLSPIETGVGRPRSRASVPNVPSGRRFSADDSSQPGECRRIQADDSPRAGPDPRLISSGGRAAVVGQLTHNKPATTTHLPSRLPTVPGRAQGMTGVVPRTEHERTKRTTNRSQTGHRGDGLEFNPAKRVISSLTSAQDPTRFKSDNNGAHLMYNNQPAPGISNFMGGYTNTAAVQMNGKKTNEQLMKYGFRPEDKRGMPNRMGNPVA